jgi:hypothetical protein
MTRESVTENHDMPKRVYSAPRLVVYGDLRLITANRRMDRSDGAASGDTMST